MPSNKNHNNAFKPTIDRLEKLFVKGKILNAEKRGRLMVHLKLEIQFSCVLCIYIRHE
jgi:hypothetical protein